MIRRAIGVPWMPRPMNPTCNRGAFCSAMALIRLDALLHLRQLGEDGVTADGSARSRAQSGGCRTPTGSLRMYRSNQLESVAGITGPSAGGWPRQERGRDL